MHSTTWDEHIIELTLHKPVILGHVDFRFSLYQPCANPPAVQVTLLKQNTSGFGYRMKAPFNNMNTSSDSSVDDNVDFKIDWSEAKREFIIFFILNKAFILTIFRRYS